MANPLTKEQFESAKNAGFTTEQIIEFEKKRLGNINNTPTNTVKNKLTDVLSFGFTPEQLAVSAETEPNPIVKGIKRAGLLANLTGREALSIPAHYFNQAALNLPRGIVEASGLEYPQPETSVGKALAYPAGIAGAATGLIPKLLLKTPEKFIPLLS